MRLAGYVPSPLGSALCRGRKRQEDPELAVQFARAGLFTLLHPHGVCIDAPLQNPILDLHVQVGRLPQIGDGLLMQLCHILWSP